MAVDFKESKTRTANGLTQIGYTSRDNKLDKTRIKEGVVLDGGQRVGECDRFHIPVVITEFVSAECILSDRSQRSGELYYNTLVIGVVVVARNRGIK